MWSRGSQFQSIPNNGITVLSDYLTCDHTYCVIIPLPWHDLNVTVWKKWHFYKAFYNQAFYSVLKFLKSIRALTINNKNFKDVVNIVHLKMEIDSPILVILDTSKYFWDTLNYIISPFVCQSLSQNQTQISNFLGLKNIFKNVS